MVTLLAISGALASSAGSGLDGAGKPLHHPERPVVRTFQAPLQPIIDAAADEFGVPRDVLSALVWEASHYDPEVARGWAGYGPLDLRDGRDPSVESAAVLLGVSADELIEDPAQNIRGGAALLLDAATRANDGVAPDPDLLEAWWDATKVFSGSHDLVLQRNFASYVFQSVWYGVDAKVPAGEHVKFGGVPVDLPSLLASDVAPGPAVPDYPGAVDFVPACIDNYSEQYNRSGSDITYIVIHTMQGSYAGSISWFANCAAGVSAHYSVRSSDGEITQSVYEEDVAWHAGNWDYNLWSIGIEHEGYVEDPDTWYTDAMYQASADLVIDILSRTSVIGDRNHIIGHVEVPGATHTDPGSGWDWDYYMSLVEGSWVIAGDLTGVIAIEDIFTGERIAGATVLVEETGDSVVVGDDGVYLFEDLPEGEYTVTASAPGYQDGGCTTTIDASGTFWCSVALFPEEPGTTGGETTGGGTTPPDPEPPIDQIPLTSAFSGQRMPIDARGGCGCGTGAPAVGWLVIGGLLLATRRR